MDDSKRRPQGANEDEGSMSRTADRQPATELARRADTLQKGLEAERDVENYRDEYDRAESRRAH